ncbi:MAG TPA: protein kinase, partial [Kofleriaceae bacterium]|nr:protein kinase [Kofleriaceae bacterium]
GKTQGAHFIAMEYVWGKDLLQIQNRLRKLGQIMPVAMACHIVSKVCEGLDYAHRKRDPMGRPLEIVHRDCSPQNILVSYEGEVKIIDFGIARAASRSSRTNAGVLKGKFGYMSPEQVRGLPLDNRSDLFAVGTVFYESLTGERLFQGESDFTTLERVRNADVRPPSELNRNIPPEVEKIVLKALSRDRDDRFQTGSEMHAALQAFLTRQAVPFTSKSLADWLKSAFAEEVARERAQMEEYRKMGRDGLIAGVPHAQANLDVVRELGEAGAPEGDPTVLGPPDLDEMARAARAVSPARGKVVRSGGGEDWEDDGPTEIFGEIGGDGASTGMATPDPDAASAQAAAGASAPGEAAAEHAAGRGAGGAASTPPPMVATPSGISPVAPPHPPQNGAHPGYFSGFDPARPPPGADPSGYSPYPPPDRYPSTAQPAPRPGRRRRRASVGRDVAIGCAIAALVLAAFVSAKFLVFDDGDDGGEAPTAAKGTIAVMADGDQPAEVTVDGEAVGVVRADAPLTLSGVAAGDRTVRVSRAGAPPCERRVKVEVDKIEVVRCSLGAAQPTTGRLLLSGVEATHRVFVDDQEITAEAAREPVQLAPGVEHSIVVKAGEAVVDQFTVAVDAGQEVKRTIGKAAAAPTDGRSEGRDRQRDAEDEDRDRDRDKSKDAPAGEASATARRTERGGEREPDRTSQARERSGSGGELKSRGSGRDPGKDGGEAGKSKEVAAATASSSKEPGTFTAFTKPWARVYIDGKDTGKMTPIAPRSAITLSPGRHKVTFVVDDQKFHFRVTIEPGKRTNMVKVLPVK